MYLIASLSIPHNFTEAIMCMLFSKPDSAKFSMEWLPLIGATVNAPSMNWSQILLNNLAKAIMDYR